MQTKGMRYAAGLLACSALLTTAAPPAHAAGAEAPWFGSVRGAAAASHTDPLYLARRYVPFWCYLEGFAWVEYTQWRASLLAVPSIYAARPATPLPTLPAQPGFVARVIQAVVPAAKADKPAPAAKVDAPVPLVAADDPAPAPAEGEPAKAPVEDKAPPAAPEEDEAAPAPEQDKAAPVPEQDEAASVPEEEVPAPAPEGDEAPPAPEEDREAPPEPEGSEPAPVPGAHAPVPPVSPTPGPPPSAPAADSLSDAERTLIALVNAERAKAGLPSLQVDTRLVETARAKSADMAQNGYFDHTSPTLGTPFEQIKAAGISYRTAGENIAGNQSVTGAHAALMNSPGHRANILKPEFTKLGIGIFAGGPYGLMVTQQFIGE